MAAHAGEVDEVAVVSTEEALDPQAMQDAVLGPLVRVVEEAAGGDPWALVGAASCRLQGADTSSPNLEFMTTEPALRTLADMLDMPSTWGRGAYLAAQRLHFMRGRVPVFVFANPVFHGRYESLSPMEVPSLWDARAEIEVEGTTVLTTPLEWELLLAVVLDSAPRITALRAVMRERGYDGRLLTRLLREGHVDAATEEAVWAVLERAGD
jgi:hypothetical protein